MHGCTGEPNGGTGEVNLCDGVSVIGKAAVGKRPSESRRGHHDQEHHSSVDLGVEIPPAPGVIGVAAAGRNAAEFLRALSKRGSEGYI